MKYQEDRWFKLKGRVVKPFNGEIEFNQVSWSHGFTHYRDKTGKIYHCGIHWFEQHATRVDLDGM